MNTIKRTSMTILVVAAAVGMLFVVSNCGGDGDGNGDAEAACRLVCDKSEECGGAPADCMSSCLQDPPSGDCLACYEEESCADVGACYNANCKDDGGEGNVSVEDCTRICEKMEGCGGEQTMQECMDHCAGRTMVDACLDCPDIEDCMQFWTCINDNECWLG